MITHYGLFWSERDAFWGRQKNPGQLLGREKTPLGRRGAPTTKERKSAKDYREYIGLYCLYGEGELLYVGEAGLATNRCLFDRLKEYRKGPLAGRWDRFSWFARERANGQGRFVDALGQMEAIVIAIINPGFNKQAGTFGRAVQAFQMPHERAEGNVETKLTRLADVIAQLKKG